MGRPALIFLRLSMMAGAFALLFFCVRAATAQEVPASSNAAPAQPYGFVPVQNAVPQEQPYGIKPIPGYTPPSPPQQLRGAFEGAVPGAGNLQDSTYGYVPLRPMVPAPASTSTVPARSDDRLAAYRDPYSLNRANADYRLGPGDKIRVSVFGQSDLSGEYQVDGSGMVRLPLIGTLHANGSTAPALEQGIAGALADGYLKDPRVNVEIATYRPFYIIGAVNRPGQYAYVDNMNALNAVAMAGGFTDQAIQSTLYVRHEGDTTERPVRTNQLTHIQPGDVIRVKTSLFWEAMNMFAPVAGPAAIAAATLR
ncbi:MAG: polysaccharide export protein [Proteobacteria bacterium]|nr:polysaccharide export protein [Pseudomonadota bacterium]